MLLACLTRFEGAGGHAEYISAGYMILSQNHHLPGGREAISLHLIEVDSTGYGLAC